jgi:transcription-repair coupling factor (superfamily II helicase)
MPLRNLLTYAQREPAVERLVAAAESEPQRVFASGSLRPFLLAAMLDLEPERPALAVVGDDRAARDLAADLRAYLAPRPVRFYPSRGVRYESHLAPPPHLVGLRVAALDALVGAPDGDAPVVVVSATALSEKVPDPELRPRGFAIDKGSTLDLDRALDQLVAAGYERVDQVEDRGQFAVRGDILDIYPATEERAVRCELFDVEVERLTWF